MDAHPHSTMEPHQRKSPEHQRWPVPKSLAAATWPFRGRHHLGCSRGVGLLGLIGLLGLLGWGVATPSGLDLLQQPSSPPWALEPSQQAPRLKPHGLLPLSFEPNQGQTDSQVHFLAHGQSYTLFLTAREAVFASRPPATAGQHPTGLVRRTGAGGRRRIQPGPWCGCNSSGPTRLPKSWGWRSCRARATTSSVTIPGNGAPTCPPTPE